MSRHTEAVGQSIKKLNNSGGVKTIGLCVPRLPPRKVYSVRSWTIGIKSNRHILQGHMAHHQKNSGKKGPSQGILGKCEP